MSSGRVLVGFRCRLGSHTAASGIARAAAVEPEAPVLHDNHANRCTARFVAVCGSPTKVPSEWFVSRTPPTCQSPHPTPALTPPQPPSTDLQPSTAAARVGVWWVGKPAVGSHVVVVMLVMVVRCGGGWGLGWRLGAGATAMGELIRWSASAPESSSYGISS